MGGGAGSGNGEGGWSRPMRRDICASAVPCCKSTCGKAFGDHARALRRPSGLLRAGADDRQPPYGIFCTLNEAHDTHGSDQRPTYLCAHQDGPFGWVRWEPSGGSACLIGASGDPLRKDLGESAASGRARRVRARMRAQAGVNAGAGERARAPGAVVGVRAVDGGGNVTRYVSVGIWMGGTG